MTEKLYYSDSYICTNETEVTSVSFENGLYAVTLAKSIIFPGAGGQQKDIASINSHPVKDMIERENEIIYYTQHEFAVNEKVKCEIDFTARRRRMQNHSGEHIISGLAHKLFGAENVGFHADENILTIDFDVKLNESDISQLEILSNLTIYDNKKIRCFFPSDSERESLTFRSKLDITNDLRIVIIDGIDACACSALHLSSTSEIGIIKILSFMPHRKGTRIFASAGISALENYLSVYSLNSKTAALLSAKQNETADAVKNLIHDNSLLKSEISKLKNSLAEKIALSISASENPIVRVEDDSDPLLLRSIALACSDKAPIVAILSRINDGGYRYVIVSNTADLKTLSKDMNSHLHGRGGGSASMISGTFESSLDEITSYIQNLL